MDQRDAQGHDPAKARFFAMQGVRLIGIVLAVAGAFIIANRLPLPDILGYLFIALGATNIFIMPLILAKRWRSGQ